MLQAGFQRLGSGFKGFGQSDADDGQVKSWLRLVHLDPGELVAQRSDDPAQHSRIDIACRQRWVAQMRTEVVFPSGQLPDNVRQACRGEIIPAGPIERPGPGLGKKMKFIAGHADRKLRGQRIEHVTGKRRQLIVDRVVSAVIRHLKSNFPEYGVPIISAARWALVSNHDPA
jgi:hypothetical protein